MSRLILNPLRYIVPAVQQVFNGSATVHTPGVSMKKIDFVDLKKDQRISTPPFTASPPPFANHSPPLIARR